MPVCASLAGATVIDNFVSDDVCQHLLGQVDDHLRHCNVQMPVTLSFRIPVELHNQVCAAVSRGASAAEIVHDHPVLESCVIAPGQIGANFDVSWHQDVTDSGELLLGNVAIIYLEGTGTLVLRNNAEGNTHHVDVLAGRLISWSNTHYSHMLKAHSGCKRVMLGPMALNSSMELCRGGTPCASRVSLTCQVNVKKLEPPEEDANVLCESGWTFGGRKQYQKVKVGRDETVAEFRARFDKFGDWFSDSDICLPDGRVLEEEENDSRIGGILGIFTQIVTLQSPAQGGLPVRVSCTAISGEELCEVSLESKETVCKFRSRLGAILRLSSSEVVLVLADGRLLSESDGDLLVSELFGIVEPQESKPVAASKSKGACIML